MGEFKFNTEGLKEVTFAEGDTLMAEGTKSNRIFLIKSGTVTITTEDKEICRISQPLSIFGEIGALLDCPHSATVSAAVDSQFYVIEDLQAYFKNSPEASIYIAEILAQRLVNMNTYFKEFKEELDSMKALDGEMAFAKRISSLILRMDRFWGREIVESKPRR